MTGKTLIKGNYELQCRFEMQERALEVIARELNENISQSLCLAKMQLGTLEKSLSTRNQKKINDAGKILYDVIQHLKMVIRQAAPDEIIKAGFIPGISKELEIKERLHGNNVLFKVVGKCPDIPAATELLIFCMVQEIINDNFSSTEQLDGITISCTKRKISIKLSKTVNGGHSILLADRVIAKLKQLGGDFQMKTGRQKNSLQINIGL